MAELAFFCGTMDCGKSTLALQTEHNHRAAGREGLTFTCHDRAGAAVVSSRLGLVRSAIEVTADLDFWQVVVAQRVGRQRVDYLICDEAQFYSAQQVDQLARLVDEMGLDVFAFGITADFRTRLFPGSQRLLELADRVQVLQVEALCWCGARATHNARTHDGVMVVEGAQVIVGDTRGASGPTPADGERQVGRIEYEVLCRRHHMRRMTRAGAHAVTGPPDVLPSDVLPIDVMPIDVRSQVGRSQVGRPQDSASPPRRPYADRHG